jgi:hypothetical protein
MSTLSPYAIAADLLDPPESPWLYDPKRWIVECIDWPDGQSLTEYQAEECDALVQHGRVAVRGPHGLGKTATAALLVHWFATTRDQAGMDWKIITTASAWRQLTHYLWPEIHKWAKRIRWDVLERRPYRTTELLSLNLKLRHGEAFAAASSDHQKIEGAHADSLLYIYDEAKAIPTPTFDATEGAFSGAGSDTSTEAFAVAQSTPGAPAGRFYDICSRKAGYEDWHPIHVTRDRVVAAGRMSSEWADQRRRQWGAESSLYRNRVEGEFASQDEDAVIPLAWVEAANDRWRDLEESGEWPPLTCVGVDVARSGADRTVFAARHGWAIKPLDRKPRQPITRTAEQARVAMAGTYAMVDSVGLGAGVVDQLIQQGCKAYGFNAGARTDLTDEAGELGFANVRSAAWWMLRVLLEPERGEPIALPPDDGLTGDLCAPRWEVRAGGKIFVEPKDKIRERIGRSTDDGDAVVQAFWPPSEVADEVVWDAHETISDY